MSYGSFRLIPRYTHSQCCSPNCSSIHTTKVKDYFDYGSSLIGRGSYGHVYKATPLPHMQSHFPNPHYALKCEDEDGVSISAIREIGLLRELSHENVIALRHVFLAQDKSIWLVLDYAEHDLLQIVFHHRKIVMDSRSTMGYLPRELVRSALWQILKGLSYLHSRWILHRDMKPGNVLVMGDGMERGRVKIADFGLARVSQDPLLPLTDVDPVIVTPWYRPPEVTLGAKHYTKAIDMWAVGCIFAELLTTSPIFYSKDDSILLLDPYNSKHLHRVLSVLGMPALDDWPQIMSYPHYGRFCEEFKHFQPLEGREASLEAYITRHKVQLDEYGFDLLRRLLTYDPLKRINVKEALEHPYFMTPNKPSNDIFPPGPIEYEHRAPIKTSVDVEEERYKRKDHWLRRLQQQQFELVRSLHAAGYYIRDDDSEDNNNRENQGRQKRRREQGRGNNV